MFFEIDVITVAVLSRSFLVLLVSTVFDFYLFVHFCNYEYLSLLGFLAKKSLSSWEKSLNKIQFTDSWFVFRDSSWSFHEPYFSRKRIFHEWYRVNVTQDYGLKTCTKCHNLKHILINDFQHHPFLYWVKVL